MEKVDNMQEQTGKVSREMKTKNKKEILEIIKKNNDVGIFS